MEPVLDEALFADATIAEMTAWAHADRDVLLAEYARLAGYRSLAEWNRLVRVCELLAVTGWGERQPVEAVAEKWINGGWYTRLRDATFTTVPGSEKGWLRRADSFVVDGEPGPPDPAVTAFATQRNPLPKNPLRLTRSGNYPPAAQAFVDEAERLRRLLDTGLAKSYGPGFGYAGIELRFSYREPGVSCDYFHDAADVPPGFAGPAYVRPRLDAGRLGRRRGESRLTVARHYTWAECHTDVGALRQSLAADLAEMVGVIARKAPKSYRVYELRSDAENVLATWQA